MEPVAGEAGLERAGQVEALVSGTTNRVEIDELIHLFCADRLDAGVDRVLDRATSVGMVTAAAD